MSKILIGVDPSYIRTGIAVFCNEKIIISEIKGKEVLGIDSFSKSFEGIYRESQLLAKKIITEIVLICNSMDSGLDKSEIEIISECPPPQGAYAPGLYALDIRLFTGYNRIANKVYRVYPNYLMHLHGKRKYEKSDSVSLAKKILENYEVSFFSKRLSHDESEAVVFLSRLLYKEGYLPDFVVKLIPNIKNEKEALFVY